MFELHPPEAICRTLGERVRTLRLARNLSQQDLASMSGVSLSTVRRLEAGGQGGIQALVQVALALGAAEGLQGLFALPTRSIAEAQSAAQAATRQRARQARRAPGRKE
ncbi:helix-turn-helix transcriptional regulator [Ottowia sp.]|uniref:helix-turn-helix domain-containing protein n=1 Tax=Ottowia sp. TaxID=1898956 RepID=UPI0025F92E92|nr:helix-turn-helix transcriptional regulator [Ottowia sp.]MBK6613045.1 helix-turn-helix transcriptional regulator [Ottowia sp.]MBK6747843.1 helix-turn-helix transcriptional regulator [Ottowia sp.]